MLLANESKVVHRTCNAVTVQMAESKERENR